VLANLPASSLHCVNCRLNLNPCFFTYCTCHMTISTSCVWLKGWFNPLCLLQSIAISGTHSSLILNQKMHEQQTCVAYMWAYLFGHLCLRSDAISKKFRDALKPSFHCNEEPYNIELCAILRPARCDVGTCLMHAECKTV